MDFEMIKEEIFRDKIKRDSTCYFSYEELEYYANHFNMDIDIFCLNVLNLSYLQIENIKSGKCFGLKCIEFNDIRKELFKKYSIYYLLEVVKIKIQNDFACSFTIAELESFSLRLQINIEDLCVQILGISKCMFNQTKKGVYKNLGSRKYKIAKDNYLEEMTEEVLKNILYDKIKHDYSTRFTYEEIEKYSLRFKINMVDLLRFIFGIKKYLTDSKINVDSIFHSLKYKKFKDMELNNYGNRLLDMIIIERVPVRGDCVFDKDEIVLLSKKYSINIRDFMVYVLGKSEQLYYDLRADRIKECFSQKYQMKKEDYLISKKEEFMKNINFNTKKYYTLDDLNEIASVLNISTYDLVVNIMNKSRTLYYNITHNYKNRYRTSIGEYKSGNLPKEYCEQNVDKLFNILKKAVKSAIGYMSSYGFDCNRFYEDLVQDGYIYIVNYGNPLDEIGNYLIIDSNYEQWHGSILYKKIYFNTLTNIRFLCDADLIGETYDINIKKIGKSSESLKEKCDDSELLINLLSDDVVEMEILRYFSKNCYSDKAIEEVCEKFSISEEKLENIFIKIRNGLFENELIEKVLSKDYKYKRG